MSTILLKKNQYLGRVEPLQDVSNAVDRIDHPPLYGVEQDRFGSFVVQIQRPVEYNQQHNSSWDSIGLDFRIGLGWIGLDWIFSPSKTKKYTVSLYIYYI